VWIVELNTSTSEPNGEYSKDAKQGNDRDQLNHGKTPQAVLIGQFRCPSMTG
jgi:hypothetical protein